MNLSRSLLAFAFLQDQKYIDRAMNTGPRVFRSFMSALLFSSLIFSTAGAQDKSQPEKLRIAVAASSLAFLVPFVAKDRGFYLKHGSDVELIQMRPNISVAALLSGEIHYIELIGSAIRSAASRLSACPAG